MQRSFSAHIFLLVVVSSPSATHATKVAAKTLARQASNPLEKVLQLLNGLQQKVVSDGEKEEQAYQEYYKWCDDAAFAKQNEIDSASAQQEKLEATIGKAESDAGEATAKIEEHSGAIAQSDSDLKDALDIRDSENANFKEAEAELMSAIEMLGRATAILEKEMVGGGGSALVQASVDTSDLESVLAGVASVIDSLGVPSEEKQKLVTLLESRQEEAPEAVRGEGGPEAYESHSASIVELMEDMKEKAESQLEKSRKAEATAAHNYELLKLSLDHANVQSNKELEEEKAAKADAAETKAVAEGDLSVTKQQLASAVASLRTIQQDCMQKASDHEATIKGRKQELKVLEQAAQTIQQTTGGAAAQTYSLVQTSTRTSMATRAALKGSEVVRLLRQLAREQHAPALSQLASRVQAVVRFGALGGEDPFFKVKGLIQEMLAKLTKEQQEEMEEKQYCDGEMASTKSKKAGLEDETDGLKAKIDQAEAAAAKLNAQVKELHEDLARLSKMQAEMDQARSNMNADFVATKADLTQGIAGIRQAIKVLRDYYGGEEEQDALLQTSDGDEEGSEQNLATFMQQKAAQPEAPILHAASQGAGGGIIGILQVIEADMATNLAEEETEEEASESKYDQMTQDNKVTNTEKGKDIAYKTKEFKALDKAITELSTDYDSASAELAAVNEYFDKVKERCVAKPEPYEQRKARREAELKGLEQALQILQGEASAAFLQRQRA